MARRSRTTAGGTACSWAWDAQQKVASLAARGVAVQRELMPALAAGQQARTVVVLDACFGGKDPAGEALARGAPMFSVPISLAAGDPRAVVLSAAGSDQVAGGLPGAHRPAFGYLVLGGLRGWADGALDGKRDGSVTAAEITAYANVVLEKLATDRH